VADDKSAILKAVKAQFSAAAKRASEISDRVQKVSDSDELAPEKVMNLLDELETQYESTERLARKYNMMCCGTMLCGDWS
jgi:DNA repair ATPase RecN